MAKRLTKNDFTARAKVGPTNDTFTGEHDGFRVRTESPQDVKRMSAEIMAEVHAGRSPAGSGRSRRLSAERSG